MKTVDDIYLYDGTFEGLMTIVYYVLETKTIPQNIIIEHDFNLNLFANYHLLETNENKANKLIKLIPLNTTKISLYIVYNVFLSNEENKELIILYYLINAFKYGKKINCLKLNCVLKALKISKMVRGEAHLLKGFIRFKELNNGILYSEIGPNGNVLQIVSNHFKKRLAQERWIIRDVNHHLVSFYENNKLTILEDKYFDFKNITTTNDETHIDKLWQCFFKTVAIKERTNKRCQMNHMPKRYWQYMNEMKGNL